MAGLNNASNLKKTVSTVFSVILDFKILGLIALNIMLIYMGTWDTVLRPCLEQLDAKGKGMEEQKKLLDEKDGFQKQYTALEQQLKSMNTELIPVPAGNSAKVVSVTEAADLLELAKGNLRDETILPRLMPPHDQRSDVSLTFLSSSTLDLLKPDAEPGSGTVAGSAPMPNQPSPEAPPGQSSGQPAGAQPGQPSGGPAPGGPAVAGGAAAAPLMPQIGSTTLPVERYDYDLKVSGTYPALVDVLNELVVRKKLIRINKVVINRPEQPESQPDAKDAPDFPVKLNMVVSISMFLYVSGTN